MDFFGIAVNFSLQILKSKHLVYLIYIICFKSQDLPFNGENVFLSSLEIMIFFLMKYFC